MTFKLPSLKGKSNADKSLVSHGLPLFQWGNLQEKEEPIGRGSFGLVFVAKGLKVKILASNALVVYLRLAAFAQFFSKTHLLLMFDAETSTL